MRKPWFLFGAVMWVLVIVFGYQLYHRKPTAPVESPTKPPKVLSTQLKDIEEPKEIWPEGLPDFTLTAHTGETITKQDLLGHPWVAAFIFTTCNGTCPALSAKMELLQDELIETDIKLISFSVDPEFDTPEVLTRYAKNFDCDPERWLFLTGSEEEIFSLIENGFKVPVARVEGAPQGTQVAHSNDFILVDEKGFVQGKADAKTDSELAAFRRLLMKRYGPKSKDSKPENTEEPEPEDTTSNQTEN